MNTREERFIREILIDGIAAKAARRAGYASASAASAGHRLMKRPDIKKAIQDAFAELLMSAEEASKRVTDTARTRLNDYLTVETVMESRMVRKPLQELVDNLKHEHEVWSRYFDRSTLFQSKRKDGEDDPTTLKRQDVYFAEQDERKEKILLYEIELELNPDAYRDVPEAREVRKLNIDPDGIQAEKERGTIKKLSFNEKGMPNIEMYPADKAQELILKLHGKLINKHDHGAAGFSFLDFLMDTDLVKEDGNETDDDDDDEE